MIWWSKNVLLKVYLEGKKLVSSGNGKVSCLSGFEPPSVKAIFQATLFWIKALKNIWKVKHGIVALWHFWNPENGKVDFESDGHHSFKTKDEMMLPINDQVHKKYF